MTICRQCGESRQFISDACPACGFRPESQRDLAAAAVLTTEWNVGDEEGTSWGTAPGRLDALAQDIRDGRDPVLDEAEIQRHERFVREFLATGPTPPLVLGLFVVFRPAILFIAGLAALWLLLRVLRAA